MNFRKLIPEDQSLINEYIKSRNNYQTDYCITSFFLFEEFKNPEISVENNSIYIKGFVRNNEVFFSPLCKIEDFNQCIQKIILYFKQKDKPFIILSTQYEYIKEFLKFNNIYPEENFYNDFGTIKSKEFILFNKRDDAEYIYIPNNFIDLEGNEYSKIREKINLFKEENINYEIIEYNSKYDNDITKLLISINEENNFNYLNDLNILKFLIENKEKLEINIYLLKVNESIAGIAIIQIMVNNIGVVHYEKTDKKYKNANWILTQFEAEKFKNCRGMSKKDDIGIEGLREVKLSYKPFCFEKKFQLYQYNEKEFFKLYKSVFGDSDNLINVVKNSENYNVVQSSFVLKNQEIVSIGGTREKMLKIFNELENIPFIFGIATKEEERKKGYASSVIKFILNKIALYKYNIAMIAPEEEYLIKYYKKFGFVDFNYFDEIPIENIFKKNFNIKIANLEDSQEITNLFQKYTAQFQITQYRNLKFTKERLKEIFADDGKVFIVSRNNGNYGYFIYEQGIITEYINLLENEENESIENIRKILENQKIEYILDCKSINIPSSIEDNSKEKIPYALIRIITPINFVKKHLDYIDFDGKDNFNQNIIVKDDILGDSIFNIKRVNKKNSFSLIADKNSINFEITVEDLMNKLIRNFLKNSNSNYKIFFTEKW